MVSPCKWGYKMTCSLIKVHQLGSFEGVNRQLKMNTLNAINKDKEVKALNVSCPYLNGTHRKGQSQQSTQHDKCVEVTHKTSQVIY